MRTTAPDVCIHVAHSYALCCYRRLTATIFCDGLPIDRCSQTYLNTGIGRNRRRPSLTDFHLFTSPTNVTSYKTLPTVLMNMNHVQLWVENVTTRLSLVISARFGGSSTNTRVTFSGKKGRTARRWNCRGVQVEQRGGGSRR